MNGRVADILVYHATRSFGSRENLVRQGERVAHLYRSLEPEEAAALARLAVEGTEPTAMAESDMILRCLGCLRPGSLTGHHEALIHRGLFYPPVIYHRAGPDIARRLLDRLPGEPMNHVLCALAWVGGEDFEAALRSWREQPPAWAKELDLPPERYAHQAGWELDREGHRRDLTTPTCRPLVPPHEVPGEVTGVRFLEGHEGACGWCGRPLTTLLDIDLETYPMVHVTPFQGRLRIAACEVCSCYGTVFTKVDMKGSFAWHGSNERPDDLPEPDEEWETLPRHGLAPGPRPRDPVESADWLVPGVSFSQLGGHPTWIQDAEYPECPDCHQTMPFVGQISNEDCQEFGEGIYYLFACGRCGVTATGYQQS
ncbi:hypothetical protein [Paludisphaera soli]|uniref:hypothetical protein n=1 Tax=Paludisphaera soli TaxID=2712865 RepID=UPI0013EB3951|nr:hypothetical protein [Paludisphaera soli]